jgi:hypothetical protein
MRTKLLCVLLLIVTVVAACGAPSAPPAFPTASSKPAATLPPSVLPTMPPSVLPTEAATGAAARPTGEQWQDAPAAAVNAAADLAQRLKIEVNTITLVSVEHVDWRDACLGIQQPGVMCAQVITPGYKVILEANGQQYEYHTNESGSAVRLVGA